VKKSRYLVFKVLAGIIALSVMLSAIISFLLHFLLPSMIKTTIAETFTLLTLSIMGIALSVTPILYAKEIAKTVAPIHFFILAFIQFLAGLGLVFYIDHKFRAGTEIILKLNTMEATTILLWLLCILAFHNMTTWILLDYFRLREGESE